MLRDFGTDRLVVNLDGRSDVGPWGQRESNARHRGLLRSIEGTAGSGILRQLRVNSFVDYSRAPFPVINHKPCFQVILPASGVLRMNLGHSRSLMQCTFQALPAMPSKPAGVVRIRLRQDAASERRSISRKELSPV
jgi:hypothetical protein